MSCRDRCQVKKRTLDVTNLSPVKNLKKRREALGRGRLVSGDDDLSASLLSILQDFSDRGFEFVADSRALPDVQILLAAATGTSSRRRYLSSVSPFTFGIVDRVIM